MLAGGPSRLRCLFHKTVNGVEKKKKRQLKWPVAPALFFWDKRLCCKQKKKKSPRWIESEIVKFSQERGQI